MKITPLFLLTCKSNSVREILGQNESKRFPIERFPKEYFISVTARSLTSFSWMTILPWKPKLMLFFHPAKPEVTLSPSKRIVQLGRSVEFICNVTRGHPNAKVTWTRMVSWVLNRESLRLIGINVWVLHLCFKQGQIRNRISRELMGRSSDA